LRVLVRHWLAHLNQVRAMLPRQRILQPLPRSGIVLAFLLLDSRIMTGGIELLWPTTRRSSSLRD
jgi:hypothetical protein